MDLFASVLSLVSLRKITSALVLEMQRILCRVESLVVLKLKLRTFCNLKVSMGKLKILFLSPCPISVKKMRRSNFLCGVPAPDEDYEVAPSPSSRKVPLPHPSSIQYKGGSSVLVLWSTDLNLDSTSQFFRCWSFSPIFT